MGVTGVRRTLQSLARIAAAALAALACVAAGQTYVFQRVFDVETLDPAGDYSPWGQSAIENLYEGLYGYAGTSTDLTPVLATGHAVSADGRTHTFKLREGVLFHSGNPFTCADAEYSVERALLARTGVVGESLAGAAALALAKPDGGAAAYAEYAGRVTAAVECLDDSTLVVRSLDPDPVLFAALASPPFLVVDSALVKANGGWDGEAATARDQQDADLSSGYLNAHVSGTAAYRLVSWVPGERLVAERNRDYWGAAPSVERVVYEVVEDEDARIAALMAGEAHQIDLRFTPVEELVGRPGVRLIGGTEGPESPWPVRVVGAIFFNQDLSAAGGLIGSGKLDGHGVPPDFFADPDVRKCFAYAWDTGEDAPENAGTDTFYPSMLLLPYYGAYDASVPHYKLDLARAEEHCRAAWGGQLWENGMYLAVPQGDWLGLFWKENIEALNPRFTLDLVEVSPEEDARLWDDLGLPWFNNAGYATFPDPYEFMAEWYQSSTSFSGRLGYVNEEIDRLIAEAHAEPNTARRDELYRRVGRLAYEDAPFVLLPSSPYVQAVGDGVEGVYRNPMFAEIRWADLRLGE